MPSTTDRSAPAFALVLLFVSSAVAGCIGTTEEEPLDPAAGADAPSVVVPEVPSFDFATVVDPDHIAHHLPSLHQVGHGLDLVGYTAIQHALPPTVRGSITQVDVWSTYAVVAGMEGGLGFAIIDIADPARPQVVSYFRAAADGWTARFSDDGAYVFYGCQILGATGTLGGGTVRGDCTDPDSIHGGRAQGGIVAVDVQDKTAPKFVAYVPTRGAHNIQVAHIDGADHVFTNAVEIVRFDRAAGKLEIVAEVPGVHDATVAKHPITGDWLLYTGTNQLAIYNVNDPAAPSPVLEDGAATTAGWRDEMRGWHEQTVVPGVVDGRVLMVLAGEVFASPRGVPDIITIVDITDPTAPAVLGTWEPPFDSATPWISYAFSAHEIAATPTGQVAIAWYHAGAWVIDVSTRERQAAPVTLAAYQPHNPITALPSTFVQTPAPMVPFVWGVGWDSRGYLLVPDMHTGLYVMEPAWGLHPAVDGGQ